METGLTKDLQSILFIDIECTPQHQSFFDLDEGMQALWEKKSRRFDHNGDSAEIADLYENRSGIFAEFGKIICISVGYLRIEDDGSAEFRITSFSGDDETRILTDFFELLNSHYNKSYHQLCGHNIKDFDVPYICRRATIHGIKLPNILDVSSKKPRELPFVDTLEMWKFGERKHFVSLDLLTRVLGLPTPKTDISGEQVARVYRDDKDLPRIVAYCERDIVAVAQVYLKCNHIAYNQHINWGITE